jgi:hypothetical protein
MRRSSRALMVSLFAASAAACGDSEPDRAGVDAETAAPDATGDAIPHDGPPLATGVKLADIVVDAPGASGTGTGDPMRAINGVRGGGSDAGGADVYSMGYGANHSITLAWSAGKLANGPGADLVVFENPFDEAGGGVFMDLIIVEVSRDGTTWRALPYHYDNAIKNVYVPDPAAWVGFAGKTPVLLNVDTNPVDPFDPAAAGGDSFDLDDVSGSDAEATAIRTDGVSYVRLTTAPSQINPDTNANYVHDSLANGADLDGMYGRYVGM